MNPDMSPNEFKTLRKMADLLDRADHSHRPDKTDKRCVACQWQRLHLELQQALFFDKAHPDHSLNVMRQLRDKARRR